MKIFRFNLQEIIQNIQFSKISHYVERLAHDAVPFRDEVSVATLQSLQPHHSCEVNWQLSVASSMTRREQGRPCGGKKGLKLSGIREGQSNMATEDP